MNSPGFSLNIPPPIKSLIGWNEPAFLNSIGAPSASPTAKPINEPIIDEVAIATFCSSGGHNLHSPVNEESP